MPICLLAAARTEPSAATFWAHPRRMVGDLPAEQEDPGAAGVGGQRAEVYQAPGSGLARAGTGQRALGEAGGEVAPRRAERLIVQSNLVVAFW